MGRQINFYMDSETEERFGQFVFENELSILYEDKKDILWVNDITYGERKLFFVPQNNISKVYTRKIENDLIILNIWNSYVIEYVRTHSFSKEKKIYRGRIYVIPDYFDENEQRVYKDESFLKLYERLTRWIKKNCPMTKYVQDNYNEKAYMSARIKELVEREGYKLW
ncbi:MAG: hypothetical protein PHP54_02530 [Clostridia bacterium]|nr:hypothetical protein [Clostridia bacterium]